MKNKSNNKVLVIILIALGGILLGRYIVKKNSKDILKEYIIEIDSSKVAEIKLSSKKTNSEVILKKQSSGEWGLNISEASLAADNNKVKSLLDELTKLKVERLISKNESKWNQYEVNDSLGSKVDIKLNSGKDVSLYIGKMGFKKSSNQNPNPYMQQNQQGSPFYHVRLENENKTYTVKGYLFNVTNSNPNNWRNSSISKISKNNITEINLDLGDGETYSLKKSDNWASALNPQIDSTRVDTFLNKYILSNGSSFNDAFTQSTPSRSITFIGDNMNNLTINCYEIDDSGNNYIVNSNLNPDSFFSSDSTGVYKELCNNELIRLFRNN